MQPSPVSRRRRKEQFDAAMLMAHEAELAEMLASFLDFDACCVYFPQERMDRVELLRQERLLLAPLVLDGLYLGAIRIQGVKLQQAKRLAPYLQPLLSLCVSNIQLRESGKRDQETDLLLESAFLESLADALNVPDNGNDGQGEPVSLGMIVIIWADAQNARRHLDAAAFRNLRLRLASALRDSLQPQFVAGRLGWVNGRHEFGVFFPASGRGAIHRQARLFFSALRAVLRDAELERVGIAGTLLLGHALYPHDLRGGELRRDPFERALVLRDRARLAAEMVWEAEHLSMPVLGYAWIASQAGKIIEFIDSSLVRINLGSEANALKGDRFHVIHRGQARCAANSVGQIEIRKIGQRESQAEILHVDQPTTPPSGGDVLIPFGPARPRAAETGALISQKRFLEKFALARKSCQNYCLAIARFSPNEGIEREADASREFRRDLDRFLCSASFADLKVGIAGWYGASAVILFLPGMKSPEGLDFCHRLHDRAVSAGFRIAIGLFTYPCLNFRRADSEVCALKALAYAELLPEPHIGILDHLALAISADHRFSEGDEMGAMEEYRLALLLKPDDPSILNSLGVCMGALNRNGDAIELFSRAVENCQEPALGAKIFYNLGAIHEKENDLANARSCFRKCVRLVPDHVYAWMRLGRIYANTGRMAGARALYNRAMRLAAESPRLLNVVQRHLARLEKDRSQTDKVREMLHDALLRDPQDGEAMLLLAQTYLEDEPVIAEHLARRCLRLGMDAWLTLADALDAMGKSEEAARVRAGRE